MIIEHDNSSTLDRFNRGLIEKGLTPCVTMTVMKENSLVYKFVEGYSSVGDKDAIVINDKTLFNIGSVTKPVTASLIVKLIEKGMLTLDDPVKKYIPEYKFDNVTLFHLMTHTAGYDEIINFDLEWPKSTSELKDYFRKIYSIDYLKYEPGTADIYCTQGYTILMDIIERITGKSLEEFAKAELFEPLGMMNTTFELNRKKTNNYALPWKKTDEHIFDYLKFTPPTGDSGLYSTAFDMIKFANLFLNDGIHEGKQIFSKASVNMMLRESTGGQFFKTPVFWYKGYKNSKGAFGDLNSNETVGHAGFSGTVMVIDPIYNITIVFFTNSNDVHDDYSIYRRLCNVTMAALV
ncbi:MAG: serine hydrolase [Clostridiaceae bacterium]|jgi:CubicO group peptidase (beta-lactamase class C family)|nr:serine hydrolase [Clostridiaceae bacterium]